MFKCSNENPVPLNGVMDVCPITRKQISDPFSDGTLHFQCGHFAEESAVISLLAYTDLTTVCKCPLCRKPLKFFKDGRLFAAKPNEKPLRFRFRRYNFEIFATEYPIDRIRNLLSLKENMKILMGGKSLVNDADLLAAEGKVIVMGEQIGLKNVTSPGQLAPIPEIIVNTGKEMMNWMSLFVLYFLAMIKNLVHIFALFFKSLVPGAGDVS